MRRLAAHSAALILAAVLPFSLAPGGEPPTVDWTFHYDGPGGGTDRSLAVARGADHDLRLLGGVGAGTSRQTFDEQAGGGFAIVGSVVNLKETADEVGFVARIPRRVRQAGSPTGLPGIIPAPGRCASRV